MSSQATVQSSLNLTNGNLQFRSAGPGAFNPTVTGTNGPTPGCVTVPVAGIDIEFSQLTALGGLGQFYNIDSTNFITVGLRDILTNEFYPFIDVLPGESYVMRLSSKLPMHETGTGTFSGSNAVVHAKTNTNPGNNSAKLICNFFDM